MIISNFYSVLFVYIIFIFPYYSASSQKLKFLLVTGSDIIQCSEHEYLVINDWTKLEASKISCPNQDKLFESSPPTIYDYTDVSLICNEQKQHFELWFYAWNARLKDKKTQKFTNDALEQMSSTITIDDIDYPFEAKKKPDDDSMALVNHFQLPWSHNNTFVLYITFKKQPTICRFELYYTQKVNRTRCTHESGKYSSMCYNAPLLTSPIQRNVNWTMVDALWTSTTYTSSSWIDRGGYYLDLRLLTTTTTSTTTKSTSTTIITTTTTTTIAAAITTNDAITTDTTIVTAAITTTDAIITGTITLTTTNIKTISTNSDHFLPVDMDLATTEFPDLNTTDEKILKTTTKGYISPNSSKTTPEKVKPSSNNSTVLKRSSANKKSSTRYILFGIFLIFLIFGIIGSILFFIFRSRRYQQNDDQSFLDRVQQSDESYKSNMDESVIDPSTDSEISVGAKFELPNISKNRKGGRAFGHFDLDAM